MEKELFDFIARYMPLSDEEKKVITDFSLFRSYEKGTVLLTEGEIPKAGYFVVKGCLRTYYIIEGEEKTTRFYTETEIISPPDVFKGSPSTYFLACVEDSIVSESKPEMEAFIFEKFPRMETLCRILSEELLAKNQVSFDDFKTSSPEERYLNLLNNRPDLVQRVPQHQLASYLGMTPQSLSRIRKRLASQKSLKTDIGS